MNICARTIEVEFKHFHIACGAGFGARGMNRGTARVGNLRGRMRCIGGVDVDSLAIADFGNQAGVGGTVLDLFNREQYVAFHGHEPPAGWCEATADDFRRAAHGETPDIVFTSMPCKGFSGLLAESLSHSAKYQALNGLALRGLWLALEAWSDDPPALLIFENVPRIATRGRRLLDEIAGMLRTYGYVAAETMHDCGIVGGLAQSRKRFLLVARHMGKVPNFVYEPPRRRLKGVGEVLDKLPLPGDPVAGPMHKVPSLQWKTWVRLAFVEAGGDWRSLNRLRVEDGMLADYGIAPDTGWHAGILGVHSWGDPATTVAGRNSPTNGAFSVADPRTNLAEYGQYGVRRWGDTSGAVSGQSACGGGAYSVADPRPGFGAATHHNIYRVLRFEQAAKVVTCGHHPAGGGQCVADPRPAGGWGTSKYRVTGYRENAGAVIAASTTGDGAFAVADPRCNWKPTAHRNKLAVKAYDQSSGTVTGSDRVGSGALCVADPRPGYLKDGRDAYLTAGMYGVMNWREPVGAINANGQHDNGKWSVADPRVAALPAPDDRLVAMIIAEDETWHRPFTTFELAGLQSLYDPEEMFERIEGVWRRRVPEPWMLAGKSDSRWREAIGNAVPSDAAEAIGSVFCHTLLLARSGQTFTLSNSPIWVQPIVTALAVDHGGLPNGIEHNGAPS